MGRAERGERIVILNRDREVAVLQPIARRMRRKRGIVGSLAGTARVRGDIASPIVPASAWFRS